MGSGGTTALLPPDKFFSNLPNFNLKSGADTQSRTGDLTLTKGALYQLSHISTLNLMPEFPTRMGRPHTTIGATAFHF